MVEVDPQVGRTRVDLSLSTTTHSDTRLTLQNSLNYGLHAPAASRNPSPIAACCRAILTASPWPSCCWLSTRLTTSSAIQGARHSPCIRSAKRLRLALLAADRGRVVESSGDLSDACSSTHTHNAALL